MSERVERRLAAVLAADVAGYSRLMGLDEERTLANLKSFRKTLVDPKITEHRGRIVKTTGDGMLMEFVSVVDAVRCAVDIQRGMAERNSGVPADRRIEFRIGIHVGDIIVDENAIVGDPVGSGLVASLARPGGNVTGLSSQHSGSTGKLSGNDSVNRRTRSPSLTDEAIAVSPTRDLFASVGCVSNAAST